jgi:hypothetical protein
VRVCGSASARAMMIITIFLLLSHTGEIHNVASRDSHHGVMDRIRTSDLSDLTV